MNNKNKRGMKKRWSSLDSFCLSPVNHVDNSLNESKDILWNNRSRFAMPFTKYSVDSLSIDRVLRAHQMNIILKRFSFAYTIFATIDSIAAHRCSIYSGYSCWGNRYLWFSFQLKIENIMSTMCRIAIMFDY